LQHPLTNTGLNAATTHHVYLNPDQLLKLKPKPGMVKQTASGLKVNNEVNMRVSQS